MTTATPGRVRRSIRFAQLAAQSEAHVRTALIRRERITDHGKLEMASFQNTQDWAGNVGMSPSGRFQVLESPQKKQKIFGNTGIRADWAKGILWVLIAVFSVALLVQFASLGATSLQIQRLENRITAAESSRDTLRRNLAVSSSDITVCTKAVELNLISSGGAPTILLVAPESATMNLMTSPEAEATEEPELRASAGGV